jgi:hypothetical protein
MLIIHLSSGHTDIQTLIAFESAFERIFSIIDFEGGAEGTIVVQDCLQLLSNLLSYNVSNQNNFRETGYIPRLARLFHPPGKEIPPYAMDQRNVNVQYALRVVRHFVVPGGVGTSTHQKAFFDTGILELVLRTAFLPSNELPLRAEVEYLFSISFKLKLN